MSGRGREGGGMEGGLRGCGEGGRGGGAGLRVGPGGAPSRRSDDAAPGMRRAAPGVGGGGVGERQRRRHRERPMASERPYGAGGSGTDRTARGGTGRGRAGRGRTAPRGRAGTGTGSLSSVRCPIASLPRHSHRLCSEPPRPSSPSWLHVPAPLTASLPRQRPAPRVGSRCWGGSAPLA